MSLLTVTRCYDVVTPESAEQGDTADSGRVYEHREMSFRDLVRELRDFQGVSCSPCSESDVRRFPHTWAVQHDGSIDYRTGECRTESLHVECADSPRVARWWAKALRVAGLVTP